MQGRGTMIFEGLFEGLKNVRVCPDCESIVNSFAVWPDGSIKCLECFQKMQNGKASNPDASDIRRMQRPERHSPQPAPDTRISIDVQRLRPPPK